MYELLFENLPYLDISTKNIQLKVANDPNFRPTLFDIEEGEEKESKIKFIELMKKSWQHDPISRPKFEEIVDSLKILLNN